MPNGNEWMQGLLTCQNAVKTLLGGRKIQLLLNLILEFVQVNKFVKFYLGKLFVYLTNHDILCVFFF